MKEATRLTRVLQVSLPIYIFASIIWMWLSATPRAMTLFAAGHQIETLVGGTIVGFLVVWTSLALVLAYGSLRLWRWAFWGNVLLALFSLAVPPRGDRFIWLAYVSDAVLIVLLGLAAIAVVRDGPWGVKPSSATKAA